MIPADAVRSDRSYAFTSGPAILALRLAAILAARTKARAQVNRPDKSHVYLIGGLPR